MCSWFTGTFSRHHICLGSPIVVDSSSVLSPCDSFVFMPTSASALKQLLLTEYAVCIFDFVSDLRSPIESLKNHPNHHTCSAVSLRKGGTECKADMRGC